MPESHAVLGTSHAPPATTLRGGRPAPWSGVERPDADHMMKHDDDSLPGRAGTLLFTSLIRLEVAAIFVLAIVLDVSRSVWVDLAGITLCGLLLVTIVVLGLRRRARAR